MEDDGLMLNFAPLPPAASASSKGKGAGLRNNHRQQNTQQTAPPAKKQRVDPPRAQAAAALITSKSATPSTTVTARPATSPVPKPAAAKSKAPSATPAPASARAKPVLNGSAGVGAGAAPSGTSRPQPKTYISSLFPRPALTDDAGPAKATEDEEDKAEAQPEVDPTNAPSTSGPVTFKSLQLHPLLVQHLTRRMEAFRPTAIQRRALPSLLKTANTQDTLYPSKRNTAKLHHDLMIHSQTGSGKTLTYLLPILHHLLPLSQESFINRSIGTLAIVLAPTRELARQIYDVLERMLSMSLNLPESERDENEDQRHYSRWLVPCLLTGGATRTHEKSRLRKGCPIIVSTPGRLLDHLQNTSTLDVGKLQWLVLDEADRLMDLGFEESLREIVKILEGRRKVAVSKACIAIAEQQNEDESESEDEEDSEEEGYGFGDARPKKKLRVHSGQGARSNRPAPATPQIPETELADSLGIYWWKVPRRTILCSATLDESVQALAGATLRNPLVLKPTAEDEQAVKEAERKATQDFIGGAADAPVSGSAPATGTSKGAVQKSTAKFLSPAQLAQHFVVVPPKLRLVTLLGLLRSSLRADSASKVKDNRIIVFLSCTDSVDFHWNALGGVNMSGQEEHRAGADADDDDADDDEDEEDAETKKRPVSGKAANKDTKKAASNQPKGKGKSIEDQVTRHSELLPNVPIYRLHGSLTQAERVASLKAFAGRNSKAAQAESIKGAVLLCTSVASRGLDLPSVRTVIQLDAPTEGGVEEYVHRIGRTARVGNKGDSWLILLESERSWVSVLEMWIGVETKDGVVPARVVEEKVEKVLIRGFGGRVADAEYEARATDVQLAFERWVLSSDDSATLARKAYMSHIRAYATHPAAEKHIFHTKFLHLGHLAKAFALREAPTAIKKFSHAPKAGKGARQSDSRLSQGTIQSKGPAGTKSKRSPKSNGPGPDDDDEDDLNDGDDQTADEFDLDLRPKGKLASTSSQLRQLALAAAAGSERPKKHAIQGAKETDAEAKMYAKVRQMGKTSRRGGVLAAYGADEFQIG